ncbi:MAG TPA: NAD(P)/FAD-dependent oxidoreductase [Bacteroidia bacterium]|nr:NAD(P)/FAD-dependent oxidoreductase [Bacteroidota bacterium]MBK7431460.1 NAD(P)/FAD-dependent oxidoreductase [Bacteroidota bacterium]MBK7571866.1 NAD(P)/FAD-dependent oxidoreductase [Bacteroidota bacterium]MBP9924052.1 NAD(P)/FAD-dependent oxidoreductase [Bacteroidia bacterium]HQW23120.1 NAD(P)/FAD-dependent oxidoreductase [Bacteroidia bacterium]
MDIFSLNTSKKRILIIGGGFGGIEIARRLDTRQYEVLLIDKHNYFTFQPLLYQVATGGLEPDSVAYPLRKILKKNKDVLFRLTEVTSIDQVSSKVMTTIGEIPYDILIIATGAMTNFFNMVETEKNALALKSVTDALNIRSFVLQKFEAALLEKSKEEQKRMMNFVVVGGGPTGVEISGALAELKRHVLPHDYPELDISMMEISILESGENVLDVMSEFSKRKAKDQLIEIGVKLLLKQQLKSYDGREAVLADGTIIETSSLIWTAGVKGNFPAGFDATSVVRGNRLLVNDFNQLVSNENIYAIGDVASMQSGAHPMVAPVAIQQAINLAKNLNRKTKNDRKKFVYKDKGSMATIGRSRAVADIKFLHLKGFFAWLAWLFIHLMLLVGFRNRVIVLFNWVWNYLSYDRAIRLIIRPYKKN